MVILTEEFKPVEGVFEDAAQAAMVQRGAPDKRVRFVRKARLSSGLGRKKNVQRAQIQPTCFGAFAAGAFKSEFEREPARRMRGERAS